MKKLTTNIKLISASLESQKFNLDFVVIVKWFLKYIFSKLAPEKIVEAIVKWFSDSERDTKQMNISEVRVKETGITNRVGTFSLISNWSSIILGVYIVLT